jgi:hypothetical protein
LSSENEQPNAIGREAEQLNSVRSSLAELTRKTSSCNEVRQLNVEMIKSLVGKLIHEVSMSEERKRIILEEIWQLSSNITEIDRLEMLVSNAIMFK